MDKRYSMAESDGACRDAAEFNAILQDLYEQFSKSEERGKVADYIPALAKVQPSHFGVSLQLLDEKPIGYGDWQMRFSIQSVSKLFTFAMAFAQRGETIWERLGKEPSGTSFNALFQLEAEKGIPRNPFINAGAMVISDMLMSDYDNPMQQLLKFLHSLTGDESIGYDEEVFLSELEYGNRNAALAYLMKYSPCCTRAATLLLHAVLNHHELRAACAGRAIPCESRQESAHEQSRNDSKPNETYQCPSTHERPLQRSRGFCLSGRNSGKKRGRGRNCRRNPRPSGDCHMGARPERTRQFGTWHQPSRGVHHSHPLIYILSDNGTGTEHR